MRGRWYRLWLVALPAYVIALFTATHLPRVTIPGDIPQSDKLVHFGAFGVLAFLWWQFLTALGRTSTRALVASTGGLLAYAALDEYLQQFVGRHTDVMDFLADGAGILVVLGFYALTRRR
ncbi:MAG: VanZ family protein [Kofleriaceae bacterium]|nr:VanZ family protein [Kofleriaceae bacterium]